MSDGSDVWNIDGRAIAVSRLSDVYWPADGLTKGDLLRYYQDVAPVMLAHLRDRPVTLRVFANGPGRRLLLSARYANGRLSLAPQRSVPPEDRRADDSSLARG